MSATDNTANPSTGAEKKDAPAGDTRTRIIEALMALAAEQRWEEIRISDVAARAQISLADFRDAFPSKGAILAAFERMIDRKVLEQTNEDLAGEPARDRLFDVLMRRLDMLTPYREGLREISAWARRDPISAIALNSVELNSMRFMLEAAGIDSEGPAGGLKLQGLVIAWARILNIWFDDDDPRLDRTMAALDRELERGSRLAARAEDFHRLTAPFRAFAGALFAGGREFRERARERWQERRHGWHDDEFYDRYEADEGDTRRDRDADKQRHGRRDPYEDDMKPV